MKHILQQPIWRYYDQSISAKQDHRLNLLRRTIHCAN